MNFILTLAVILLCGLLLSEIVKLIRLPGLIGMLVVGVVLGPYALNWLSPDLLNISADIRELALILILTRAGLKLDIKELKKNGRSAILLCFLPATFEIAAYVLLGTLVLKMDVLSAAILGTVMGAASTAVIVPSMLKIQEEGYGNNKKIPQFITTSVAVEGVYVLMLFAILLSIGTSGTFDYNLIWKTPLSVVTGIGIGAGSGLLLNLFFKKVHIRDSIKVIVLVALSCLFVSLEVYWGKYFPFSGTLAVLSLGAGIYATHRECAGRLSNEYSKLWLVAEILLFILVGAEVDIQYAASSGGLLILVMFACLLFGLFGAWISVPGKKYTWKEQLFVVISFIPKATVQAAIGAIPLTVGMGYGKLILTVSVLGILIGAPLGAFLINISYKKLLTLDENHARQAAANINVKSVEVSADEIC